MSIYITGDTHGDYNRLVGIAGNLEAGDILVVCGDWGYVLYNDKDEARLLDDLEKMPYSILFVDGNHENFPLIYSYPEEKWNGGKIHRIRKNIAHLKRGQVFTIEGLKFFTFGGGESTDKDMRVEHNLWWREEEPTPVEMAMGARALDEANKKVDYIITHEPPSLVKSAMLLRSGNNDRVNKLNGYFEEIGKACEFKHWYFGSLHEDKVVTPHYTCVFKKVIPILKKRKRVKKAPSAHLKT